MHSLVAGKHVPIILLWDSYGCHWAVEVKAAARELNILPVGVFAGTTPLGNVTDSHYAYAFKQGARERKGPLWVLKTTTRHPSPPCIINPDGAPFGPSPMYY